MPRITQSQLDTRMRWFWTFIALLVGLPLVSYAVALASVGVHPVTCATPESSIEVSAGDAVFVLEDDVNCGNETCACSRPTMPVANLDTPRDSIPIHAPDNELDAWETIWITPTRRGRIAFVTRAEVGGVLASRDCPGLYACRSGWLRARQRWAIPRQVLATVIWTLGVGLVMAATTIRDRRRNQRGVET